VRHARPDELAPLDGLLAQLRTLDGLTEKKPGTFYRRSKAFLHFHVDGADLYADVRLDGPDFDRKRVTTKAEQARLAREIRAALQT
jgi:hypothetical protein